MNGMVCFMHSVIPNIFDLHSRWEMYALLWTAMQGVPRELGKFNCSSITFSFSNCCSFPLFGTILILMQLLGRYIEFFDAMSVPMGIALSGQPLLGQPVMVKPSEAEKNLVQSTTATAGTTGGGIGPYSGGARRLYVGNLHINMKEDQLRQVEIIVPFLGQTVYSCHRVIIVARKTVDICSLPKMVYSYRPPIFVVSLTPWPFCHMYAVHCPGFRIIWCRGAGAVAYWWLWELQRFWFCSGEWLYLKINFLQQSAKLLHLLVK